MAGKVWTAEDRAAHAEKMKRRREEAAARMRAAEQDLAIDAEPEIETMAGFPDEEEAGEAEPVEAAIVEEDLSPYGLFIASLSDETRELFSEDELREMFAAAERQATQEKKRQLKQAAQERAQLAAQAAAGLLPEQVVERKRLADKNQRKVRWTVSLPYISGADEKAYPDDGIRLDGRKFQVGQEVVTSYAQWRSALDIQWALRQHEMDFQGKGLTSQLRRARLQTGITYAGV